MNQKQKKCKHRWEHIVISGLSQAKTPGKWLVHECLKCNLRPQGSSDKII